MISTVAIDDIYNIAMRAGASGGKILGAGGGGFMLIFASPHQQAAIRKKLKKLIEVKFRFENEGSRIIFYKDSGIDSYAAS
jgi:D-glycero-alpha-D-manno-heptose-7-phosphate kinase